MARIRYLKPDFFKDEDLKDLPFEARLFYQGLWCMADKAGRGEDRPERLKVEIFPYDNVNVETMMQLLAGNKKTSRRPFIVRYEIDKERYFQILNWHRHQKPHHTEKTSQIPPYNPPKGIENIKGMENQHKASAGLKNGSLSVKQFNFKVFNELWLKYPKKLGKKEALRHFKASVKTAEDIAYIHQALNNYLASERVAKGYIQNASTWFNNWRDWIEYTETICFKCKGKGKYVNERGYEVVCDCQPKEQYNPRL